jgi:hypothetical protein
VWPRSRPTSTGLERNAASNRRAIRAVLPRIGRPTFSRIREAGLHRRSGHSPARGLASLSAAAQCSSQRCPGLLQPKPIPDLSASGATVSPVEVRHRSGRASRGGRWHLDRDVIGRSSWRGTTAGIAAGPARTDAANLDPPRAVDPARVLGSARAAPSRRSPAPAAGAKFSPYACRVVPSRSEPPGQGARSPGNATDSPTRSTIAASRSSLASRPSLALGESGSAPGDTPTSRAHGRTRPIYCPLLG